MDILLSAMIFAPALAALIILAIPGSVRGAPRLLALLASLVSLFLSLEAYAGYHGPGFAFVEKTAWLPALGAGYHIGVDGLSLPLIVLTTLIVFVVVLVAWRWTDRPKEYFLALMFLETGMLGVFSALDLFLFFFFFELVLVPMYFLIGIWGGPRKDYASIKFILYTGLGSAVMFLAFLALRLYGGTFDLIRLSELHFAPFVQIPIFLALFFAWAVKTPIVPLHTWLPDAHVEAPTTASMILAGVLLKMGTYGLLRFNLTLFPAASHLFAGLLSVLAVINILYGAFLAMAQEDLKKMVAYASISSMGYVLLGTAAAAASGSSLALGGAVLQMFSHGIVSAFMFMMVGAIYDRAHTRQIKDLGGLATQMPVIAWLMEVGALAYLGLPGLIIFVSEFSVFLGSYAAFHVPTILAGLGLIYTAAYLLWMAQRVLFGPFRERWEHLKDARGLEVVPMALLVGVMLLVGLYPAILTHVINPSVTKLVGALGGIGR